MELFNFILKVGKGKDTVLDKAYSHIVNGAINSSEAVQERWDVYNLIVTELAHLGDGKLFKEFKYRLTDGENANAILLDILLRIDCNDVSGMVWCLKRRVEEFKEEDFINELL